MFCSCILNYNKLCLIIQFGGYSSPKKVNIAKKTGVLIEKSSESVARQPKYQNKEKAKIELFHLFYVALTFLAHLSRTHR